MVISLDFETYSEAGTVFDLSKGRFSAPSGVNKKGIGLVGAYAYAAHPSTEILCASYTLDSGNTIKTWIPGGDIIAPEDLLSAISWGAKLYAYNSFFEWCIWNLVACRRYGWPELSLNQTRDVMAAALAWSLPGSLDNASAALFGETRKDKAGSRIMLKLSQPRNPTANSCDLRYFPDNSEDWINLYKYCEQDVRAEIAVRTFVPELTPRELEVWKLDQKINARGVMVDQNSITPCIKIVEEGRRRAGLKLSELTDGVVNAVSKAQALLRWVGDSGLPDLRPKTIKKYLETPRRKNVKKALELRLAFGGNSIAKLYSMLYRSYPDNRVRGAFQYCGAQRTRRWAGRGLQPQNMPRGDVTLLKCDFCGGLEKPTARTCSRCGFDHLEEQEWGVTSVEAVLPALQSGEYDLVNVLWGNPNKIVAGCLRSFLIAAPGHDFISSDYSAIEAVVMACLSGEQWVIDTFFGDGKLYERTAAKISGKTPKEIIGYKKTYGKHHPLRRLGKVAALASQYQGARGAWLAFGADKFLSVSEIDEGVRNWRSANPSIVNFWNNTETAAKNAILNPDQPFLIQGIFASIRFQKKGRALYCILPNDEWITYLDAGIEKRKKLSFAGWDILEAWESAQNQNDVGMLALEHACQDFPSDLLAGLKRITNPPAARNLIFKYCWKLTDSIVYKGVGLAGKMVGIETYGGKLAENIVQAVSRFILSEAMLRIEATGYPIVLHTHDEIVSEVPKGFGSIENFEEIMSVMPEWAKLPTGRYWPIRAAGGWRGKRYRK